MPSLVDKEHLPNAIALNSIQFNLARVIGPLLAGAALTAFGMVACFGLNGLSFLAVIVAILSLHIRHIPTTATTRMLEELKSGLSVRARRTRRSIGLTVLGFATTFLGNPLLTFLPLFAQDVFRGDVDAVHAADGLRRRRRRHRRARRRPGSASSATWAARCSCCKFVFGPSSSCSRVARVLWLNAILLFGAGACMVMVFAMLSSLVQLIAPNEMRGRVMSIYMVAFRGGMPLGSLVAGWLATLTSAPARADRQRRAAEARWRHGSCSRATA